MKPAARSKETGVAVVTGPGCLRSGEIGAAMAGGALRVVTGPEAALAGDGPVLVWLSDPATWLAAALAGEQAAEAALAEWVQATQAVFALRKSVQRRVVMADDRLLAPGGPRADLLAEIRAGLGQDVDLPVLDAPDDVPPVLLARAETWLRADPDVADVVAHWRAVVVGAEPPRLSLDAVAEMLGQGATSVRLVKAEAEADLLRQASAAQQDRIEAALRRLTEAEAEADLLRQLGAAQQAQIDEATRSLAAAEARIGGLMDEVADRHVLNASVEALERRLQDARSLGARREAVLAARVLADGAALAAAQAETGATRAELAETQAEMARAGAAATDRIADLEAAVHRAAAEAEAASRRQAELETDLAASRHEAEALRQELEKIYASHSWKMTEPLRAGRRILGG
jgi:hypothetical protein